MVYVFTFSSFHKNRVIWHACLFPRFNFVCLTKPHFNDKYNWPLKDKQWNICNVFCENLLILTVARPFSRNIYQNIEFNLCLLFSLKSFQLFQIMKDLNSFLDIKMKDVKQKASFRITMNKVQWFSEITYILYHTCMRRTCE